MGSETRSIRGWRGACEAGAPRESRISGILDKRTTDSLNRMPGIADVPILGQIFRSKSLNPSVMELVVVVTPTIVDPLTSDEPPPPNPDWVVAPGSLGNFDKNLPKSYNQKQ